MKAPRKIRTMFDGNPHCDGIPAGRQAEILAQQGDHGTLAWRRRKGAFAGDDLVRFASRADAVEAWRAQERNRCLGEHASIVLVVKDA